MATKINEQARGMTKQDGQANDKECSSGMKVKRKSRSARKRLNAMMSNASFHFSDTDSEGELTMITSKIGKLNPAQASQENPLISVTDAEVTESKAKVNDNLDYLIADGEARSRSRRGSFAENLTDVDELYIDEVDEKDTSSNLNVADNGYQGETDLEDMEGDEGKEDTRREGLKVRRSGAGRAGTTRTRGSERESGTRHLPLPRGNLTFRLGLREPTDPEEKVEGRSPTT